MAKKTCQSYLKRYTIQTQILHKFFDTLYKCKSLSKAYVLKEYIAFATAKKG